MKNFHNRYYISKDLAKDLTKLASAMFDKEKPHAEINNPKPILERLGIVKPKSMQEKIERLFEGPRGLIQQMYEQGEETPDEMNDFFIPGEEEGEPLSPYEYQVMQEETLRHRVDPAPDVPSPSSHEPSVPTGGTPNTQEEPNDQSAES